MVQHVVIGGGAAGIQATIRLLTAGCDVLLIERGPARSWQQQQLAYTGVGTDNSSHTDSIHRDPISWGDAAYSTTSPHTVQYDMAPQAELYDRIVTYPQGIGLGGSMNVNAMIWTAGNRRVFDEGWPADWNSELFDR